MFISYLLQIKKIANERKTEDLVDAELRRNNYFDNQIKIEKQKSDIPRIQKLLENASKSGMHGAGKPEFIIHDLQSLPEFLVVIECKADTKKHESTARNKFADFAVDGALLYASFLSREFDVLAIAVSGEDKSELRQSFFFQLRGSEKPFESKEIYSFISLEDFYNALISSEEKFRQDYTALLDYSRILNDELQARKVAESERAFLISGILIGLQNRAFKESFRVQKNAKQLGKILLETIQGEFETASLPEERRLNLIQAFSFIPHSPALHDKDFFVSLIAGIDGNINGFMQTHKYYDTIGQFYVEFLRYANNDKGLGIVLTPGHIAELFIELVEVNKDSIIFDNCCGTGGLLIAAMRIMIRDAGADRKIHKRIKNKQLFGIEFQPQIYALAVSNMILHGDGKTNILRGDCFKDAGRLLDANSTKPTIGVLNPPYKNKKIKTDREELEFVLNNLDALSNDGRCIAIVPITCATAPDGKIAHWKIKLLEKHTLEGVVSLPVELFHNSKTTVVTCAMIFTAHRPHPKGKKSWFGYWRDDGFVKTKHRGRIDLYSQWNALKSMWVNSFRNREILPGLSVMKEVTANDEWCAEAYLETDYSQVTEHKLAEAARDFALIQVRFGR